MKKIFVGFSIGAAAASVLVIIFLATGLWKYFFYPKKDEHKGTKVITPREAGLYSIADQGGLVTWDESIKTKIPMEDGEMVIAVLNRESEEIPVEEQFVVFSKISGAARETFITHISFDEGSRRYIRIWDLPVAAARAETISVVSQDIIGDRNACIIVTGMNNRNEHTMTVFRQNFAASNQMFNKIAELQIDGPIVIQETARSPDYQQGTTNGHSFNIAAYSHDSASNNILDQIETIYSFNQKSGQYEKTGVSRVPGSQAEQRQLREILNGTPGVFENFINDLWYYVSPKGTIDSGQYLYFDPDGREIIFYGDEAQQIFHWQTSTPTRYGLYIRSQNTSISTLRRFIDIEMESMDSIKLRVTEDVQLKIAVSTTWDGSYRRAETSVLKESRPSIKPAVNALYDSSWGRFQFRNTGEYTINSGNTVRKGHYVFYKVNEQELLELREGAGTAANNTENRMVYSVERIGNSAMLLSRIRLGTDGIYDLFEPVITFTPVEN